MKNPLSATLMASMMFACIGVGLYTYGVSEPISYYRGVVTKLPMSNDDQRAQQAITLTLFHWGLHGWIPSSSSLWLWASVCYRTWAPDDYSRCVLPALWREYQRSFGDAIDALSIATTTFGVYTPSGLASFNREMR